MVELSSAPYDNDDDDTVPFAMASVVDIDAELLLSQGSIVTAEAIRVSAPGAVPFSSPDSSVSSVTVEPVPSDPEDFGTSQPLVETIDRTSSQQQQQNPEDERNMAAGAAGAVIGLLIGGPVISVVLGFGSVYYTKEEGVTGDLARALGDVALVARDKFRKVDSEHHILEQGRAAAAATLHRVQDAHQTTTATRWTEAKFSLLSLPLNKHAIFALFSLNSVSLRPLPPLSTVTTSLRLTW